MGTRSIAAAAMKPGGIYETPGGAREALQGLRHTIGRESPYSLCNQELVMFEEGAVAYGQRDAAGFIKLNALRPGPARIVKRR